MFKKALQLLCFISVVILSVNRVGVGFDKIVLLKIGNKLYNNHYFSNCAKFINSEKYQKYCFILIGSASFACPTGDYIMIIEQAQERYIKCKFIVVMFNDYSEKDLDNIKYNNKLKINFIRASNRLQALKDEGLFPFGFIFVSNSNGEIINIDNIQDPKMKVADKIEKIVDFS